MTMFAGFSIKSYIVSEISSPMEKLICECISFGGVKMAAISKVLRSSRVTRYKNKFLYDFYAKIIPENVKNIWPEQDFL